MPDNIQGQPAVPESPSPKDAEKKTPANAKEVSKAREHISPSPQPTVTANNKAAIQNIQQNLKSNQAQQPAQQSTTPQAAQPPAKKPTGSDDAYIKAAEKVIEKDKNDPYKEEEDHEDVQVQYLHDRFGKNIKKT